MKLLSRLVVAALICSMAIPALTVTTPVQAQGEDEPMITVYPSSDFVGEEVRVYGVNFEPGDDVIIYYYHTSSDKEEVGEDEVDDDGEFSVKFIVPESTKGEHRIRATDESGDTDSDYFEVEPKLEISPEEGFGDETKVTVTGTGFEEDEEDIEVRYYLDTSDYTKVVDEITADEYGSWEATFTAPASSKGTHKIDAKGDDTSLSEVEGVTFEVESGISLSKSSGYVEDKVTVKGGGFEADERDIKVTYGGEEVGATTAEEDGSWTISFKVPSSAKGKHKIDAYGDDTKASDITDKSFTVLSRATLFPTEGHVGISLTLQGDGFAASQPVNIKYDAKQIATTATDDKGTLSATFSVPKSKHGEHIITVTDGAGNTISSKFVMESEAPAKPALNSPGDGSRIGLMGKASPEFEWQVVEDPSIVTYSFQLGADADFAKVLISREGLSQSSYALSEAQALPYGTYYWRVKAIDGAQNDSGWTVPCSFKSGLLPLWAFIAIIALVVVLIGVLVYFVAIRRRAYYD